VPLPWGPCLLGVLVVFGIALRIIVGRHLDNKPLSQDAATAGSGPIDAGSIARGMLFSQNCTMCHGESGRGDGPAASSLRIPPANLYDHIPYHPDQFFFGVITNGLGGVMPSFKASISDDDRWNILNYLRDRFGEAPAVQ
jgi:mono/diheme cytochrome c family protein